MRFHLFEWEDFAWYPDVLRTAQTDYLRFLMDTFDVFRAVVPHFARALKASGEEEIVDFCSGGGGSLLIMQQHLRRQAPELPFRVTLTDLYPNLAASKHIERRSEGAIRYYSKPVDVRRPPAVLNKGFWTVFNGFHHLREADAKSVLEKAVQHQRPIGIFEPIDKSLLQLVINTFALTILMFLVTPFIRPFRLSRLVFTYLIPLIPLCTLWDGWVSVLRLYPPKVLLNFAEKEIEGGESYHWTAGKARHIFGTVIYLIGLPYSSTSSKSSMTEKFPPSE